MKSVVQARKCHWCGATYYLHDGRFKYCSDKCYEEAHRARCRENFRRRYNLIRDTELERYRKYYAENHEAKLAKAKAKKTVD